LTRTGDFSLQALYAALDAQRQARGLSWAQATREINRRPDRSPVHPLSASTVTRTRTGSVAEGDGVLQMLLWLNRTPESFMPGHHEFDDPAVPLPAVSLQQILRFDTKKLQVALDAQRAERQMTWRQVAKEVGLGVSSLTYPSRGTRTGFPHVMRMLKWLGRPAADFTRICDR